MRGSMPQIGRYSRSDELERGIYSNALPSRHPQLRMMELSAGSSVSSDQGNLKSAVPVEGIGFVRGWMVGIGPNAENRIHPNGTIYPSLAQGQGG